MPFDLFISYAHRDNTRGQVRELRDAIVDDFRAFAGRELIVFFDEHDLPSMADWEARIGRALSESRLFLAVLSPSYLESRYCRREWDEYVRYEAMRQCLGEGIAPVFFVTLPAHRGGQLEPQIVQWIDEMYRRQACDLTSKPTVPIRPWHEVGRLALEDSEVERRLNVLKQQMAERLSRADRGRQSPTNAFRHNPQFVGRVRELTLLREAVNERGSVGVVGHQTGDAGRSIAIHGIGGLGKTELVLAYAHAFAWDYPGGRWLISCENLPTFDAVLRDLGHHLRVVFTDEQQRDVRKAADRVLAELRSRDRTLLMLDNVTRREIVSPAELMRLPPQQQVHVIITTRLGPSELGGSPQDHSFVAVDELPDDDAIALIRAHQPRGVFAEPDDEIAARQLVGLLRGYTLAVETAAIYLGKFAAPGAIARYCQRLRANGVLEASETAAANSAIGVRHREALLEPTLALTFETLSVPQLYVLAYASHLPADQLALTWLRELVSSLAGRHPIPDRITESNCASAVESLLSLRLLTPAGHPHVGRIHRLVQQLVGKLIKRSVAAMVDVEHHPERASIAETLDLVGAQSTRIRLSDYALGRAVALFKQWHDPNRHWEIDVLVAVSTQWLNDEYLDGVDLVGPLAAVLYELARFDDAEALLRKTLPLLVACPDRQSELPIVLHYLAKVLRELHYMEEATTLVRRAMQLNRAALGANHRRVAENLRLLATIQQIKGQLSDAEESARHALSIDLHQFGSDAPQLAASLSVLAGILKADGRIAEASELFHELVRLGQAHHTDQDADTQIRNNFAQLMVAEGRIEEAESIMRQILEVDQRILGPNHPDVARDLNNLGRLLQDSGRLDEATPLVQRALAIYEERLGPQHPHVALALNNVAGVLTAAGKHATAEPLLARAVSIAERELTHTHATVAGFLTNHAGVLLRLGRFVEAETAYRRAIHNLARPNNGDSNETRRRLLDVQDLYTDLLRTMGCDENEIVERLRSARDED